MIPAAVLAPNWLGDAIMSLPAFSALLTATPDRSWTVLARAHVAPVYKLADLRTHVVALPPPRHWRLPRVEAREVVVLPNSFHAAMLALRLGARRRIGYARDGRAWLLHPAIPPPAPGTLPAHESFYYLELLRLSGFIPTLPADDPASLRVPLHPDPARVAHWRGQLAPAPIVVLHAGATNHQAKCWAPERFAELGGTLARRGATVVLIGGTAERELARQVRMLAPHPEQLKNLAGETSLEDLVALVAAADLLVANDSGPMHVAGAVGTPVVAMFGPTNEHATCPLTEPGQLHLVTAPGGAGAGRTMDRISVANVLEAAEAALATAGKPKAGKP